ncbi:MAG: tRNA threonylcarbamoyladenosine dehydratase [Eubacterium sp.]
MASQFDRTALLIGEEGIHRLKKARVILFGVGGVGSYVAEALVRSGIGALTLVDKDVVELTNINRQLIALHSTVGKVKVAVLEERLLDINPLADIRPVHKCYLPENASEFELETYDYVIDAIDMVTAKLHLITTCDALNIPMISSMGTGNKLDPGRVLIKDIFKKKGFAFAKMMRPEQKKRPVKKIKVLY